MIVLGALLSAISIGVRSQTVWFTVPLLLLVLLDRIGRGVAGAILGSAISFLVGALAWGVPLDHRERRAVVVSRGAGQSGRRGLCRR